MVTSLQTTTTENPSQVNDTMGETKNARPDPTIEEALLQFFETRYCDTFHKDNHPDVKAADREFELEVEKLVLHLPKSERFAASDPVLCAQGEITGVREKMAYRGGFLDALTFMNPDRMRAILENWE